MKNTWRVGTKVAVNVYKNDAPVCMCQTPALAAEIVLTMNAVKTKCIDLDWQPIDTAPKNGTYILLRGDSGYIGTPYRVQVGRWSPGYRDFWINHASDAFTDDGSEATHWAPLPWKER